MPKKPSTAGTAEVHPSTTGWEPGEQGVEPRGESFSAITLESLYLVDKTTHHPTGIAKQQHGLLVRE
jgi:hypothetical protein